MVRLMFRWFFAFHFQGCKQLRNLIVLVLMHWAPGLHKMQARFWSCTQTICVWYWLLCIKGTWSFLFFCPLLCCLLFSFIILSCLLPCCAAPICLFICFYKSPFCSLAINQTFLGQSKGWFPFVLLCRQGTLI